MKIIAALVRIGHLKLLATILFLVALCGCIALLILPFLPDDAQIQTAICTRNQFAISVLRAPPTEGFAGEEQVKTRVKPGWCKSSRILLRPLWIEDLRNISTYSVLCDDAPQQWFLIVRRGQVHGTYDKQFASVFLFPTSRSPYDYIFASDSVPYMSSRGIDAYCNLEKVGQQLK